MFFIAKILQTKTRVIIPKTWVFDVENYWERWVNNGISKNEKFKCFYSNEPEALDGQNIPNQEYIPDWTVFPRCNDVDFPEHGCYDIKILHSTGKVMHILV